MSELIDKANEASTLLKTISHPHRLMICCALVKSECSVSDLIDIVGISQTSMSNHLSVLRQANIVDFERDHRILTYRLKDPKTISILDAVYEIYCGDGSMDTANTATKNSHACELIGTD